MKLLIWYHKWRARVNDKKYRKAMSSFDCGRVLGEHLPSTASTYDLHYRMHINWLKDNDPNFPVVEQ